MDTGEAANPHQAVSRLVLPLHLTWHHNCIITSVKHSQFV